MRDRMPPGMLARAKGQSDNTNRRNVLAELANGHAGGNKAATGAERRIAEEILHEEVGAREAKRLIKQAQKRARGSF